MLVRVVLCTTAVDWTKPKLATNVIATAAAPQDNAFKPLFIKVFMIALSPLVVRSLCTMQLAVVMVLYITTSLDECQAISLEFSGEWISVT